MKWFLIAVSSLGLMVGCQENSKPMPRGLLGPDGKPLVPGLAAPEVARAEAAAPAREAAPHFQQVGSPFGSAAPPPAPAAPTLPAPAETAAAPERDLSSELANLI